MAYDRYQLSEPVTENSHVLKGVMVVGTSTVVLHPQEKQLFLGSHGIRCFRTTGETITITGTAQGNIYPVAGAMLVPLVAPPLFMFSRSIRR